MTKKSWTRCHVPVRCGSCWGAISAGQPVLAYQLLESSRRLLRCAACAGEPVPAELAPLVPLEPRVTAVRAVTPRLTRLGEIVRDFKLAQAGEREIGEEG